MAANSRFTYTAIQDPHDPRLTPYRSLKGKELEKDGIFIAEGEKVIKCMVESGCIISSCLTAAGSTRRYKSLIAAIAKRDAPIYTADDGLIENIIGFRFHKGIMAVGKCPEKRKVSDLPKTSGAGGLIVALNAVNDPQNVGLIVRNAAAFGVKAIIVDGATYDPYYRKAVRVSMGTIFTLPVYYADDLAPGLKMIKKKYNTRVIAATLGAGAKDIAKVDLSGNVCFVFGNEDKGVSPDVLKVADAKVRIPISKGVDSLNVASACAVSLYEASRRGTKSRSEKR